MSAEDTNAFFARLEADTTLQERARALQCRPGDERVLGLCALASELGLSVTVEDLNAAAAPDAPMQLDDETLRDVAGGYCGVSGAAVGPYAPLG